MTVDPLSAPTICFVGLANLPVLAPEYGRHGVGGAELQQTLLAKALAARGYPVSMVVADYGQPDGAVWDGVKTYKAYRPHAGLPVVRFIHPRWTLLWAALKRARADIYYVSCAGALVGQVALFARLHGAKVIFRIASNSDCDPATLLIRHWRDKRLYRFGLRRADVVLAQTPEQQQALLKNFRRDSRVASSLTDTEGRRPEFAARDISVLWVGNIRALKRPELLLAAARKLPELQFHIIGGPMPGSERLYAALRAEALELPNVRFHGPVPYHQIGEFYERARVFVGTSEIEGFPNTYLQAWGRGTPVVAFLDPEQLIARNGMGRAITSVSEMCAAIVALTEDSRAWEAASQRCREFMDNRFNVTRMTAPYVDAVSDLQQRTFPACRSVLMVGTDLDGMGGVRAVVKSYIDGGLLERYDGVYVGSHRAGSVGTKILTALKAWMRIPGLLRKLDAPLVHVHTASRGSFWRKSVVCFMARVAGRPYVVHLHGGGFTRFYEEWSGPFGRFVIRSTLAHAALVIALSQEWRERLLKICPTAKVEILHNAVAIPDRTGAVSGKAATPSAPAIATKPITADAPAVAAKPTTANTPAIAATLEDSAPTLLYLGHLQRAKGIYDLVRAFAQLATRFPKARLVLGGTGESAELNQLATQLGVKDRVATPGWLGPEDKNAALASSTIFLLPSYMEGMPMSLLEAMSWGLPVIATPVGGIPQVVTNDVNGLLITPGDVNGLAAALTRLLEDPALRERLGTAARVTIETRFSLDDAMAKLKRIYARFGLVTTRPRTATNDATATAGEID